MTGTYQLTRHQQGKLNQILREWKRGRRVDCEAPTQHEVISALLEWELDRLLILADGEIS